jgi:hypothetical protein
VQHFTLLDNVSGLKWKHSGDFGLRGISVEPFIMLDNAQVVLPPSPAELFVVHRAKIEADKLLTWIGLYRAAPLSSKNRKGDYCGVGVWLLNNGMSGYDLMRILHDLMGGMTKAMQNSSGQLWDVTRLQTEGLSETFRPPASNIESKRDLGGDTICLDASGRNTSTVEEVLEEIQDDPVGRFDGFTRILLSSDADVLRAVEARRRIPVKRVPEFLLSVNKNPVPRRNPGVAEVVSLSNGSTKLRTTTSTTAPAASFRPQTSGDVNEVTRQIFETKRANARIDELFKDLDTVNLKVAQHVKRIFTALIASFVILLFMSSLVFLYAYNTSQSNFKQTQLLESRIESIDNQMNSMKEFISKRIDTQYGPPQMLRREGNLSLPVGFTIIPLAEQNILPSETSSLPGPVRIPEGTARVELRDRSGSTRPK